MEFKRCVRCGCFFYSDNDVCLNCETKDRKDISKLNSFIENNISYTKQDLSNNTGVTITNIDRFINNNYLDNFKNINL